jgi:hypothetical protein
VSSCSIFFCDPLEDKVVYTIQSRSSYLIYYYYSEKSIAWNGIVFPFIIWFYGSAIVIIRGWGCGFGNSEDIVTWSDNRPSFKVLGFIAVVAYCGGI